MQNITAGDLIEGTDVTMGNDVVGTVTTVLYYIGRGRYSADCTHAIADPAAGHRYIVLPLDPEAREVIVDGARAYVPTPVDRPNAQVAADAYAQVQVNPNFLALRNACRIGLAPGELRTVTRGPMTVQMFAVSGGSFTRVDVRRNGELMLGLSGTHQNESDAARQFADAAVFAARTF